jgi:hypothetical protein
MNLLMKIVTLITGVALLLTPLYIIRSTADAVC